MVLLRYYPWGMTLLSERRMKRRRLAWRLQARREELEAYERRLKELEGAQEESEDASLAQERQEVQQLRRRVRRLERRMQNPGLRAQGRRNVQVRKLLRRASYVKGKLLRR